MLTALFWFLAFLGSVVAVGGLLVLLCVAIGVASDRIIQARRGHDPLLLTRWEKDAIASAVGTCRQAAEDVRSNGPDFDGVEDDQVATALEAILARSK